MTPEGPLDLLAMVLLLLAAVLSLTAAIGLLRFPDVLSQLHPATKPQVLGILLILVAIALRVGITPDFGMLVLAGVFQMMTIPVTAHMIGRAVYRAGQVSPSHLVIDELSEDDDRDDREVDGRR